MQLSRRSWQGLALVFLVFAFLCSACGVLFTIAPPEPTAEALDPFATGWQISRGCFFGPAIVILLLAYVAFRVSRRRDKTLQNHEMIAILGIVVGLILVLFGLAIVITPAVDDTLDTVLGMVALCILPGLGIMASAGIFWFLSRSRKG